MLAIPSLRIVLHVWLSPGNWTKARPVKKLLATLDDQGDLDALPVMVEMSRYCGQSFQVSQHLRRRRMGAVLQELVLSSCRLANRRVSSAKPGRGVAIKARRAFPASAGNPGTAPAAARYSDQ